MLHEIAPYRFDNQYRPVSPTPESLLLCCRNGSLLIKRDSQGISFPKFQDFERILPSIYDRSTYLFAIDGTAFFLPGDANLPAIPGFSFEDAHSLRGHSPAHLVFAGLVGLQLAAWYQGHRFCPKCGRPLRHDPRERMLSCLSCGTRIYPRISPAVIAAVTDGDRLLLTKYASGPYKNYALIAGFAEIGEPIEDTVRREVFEETGLRVKNLRYYKSQPWPLSSSLLFGFFCDLDGSGAITLQEEELALAQWIDRSELPDYPLTDSLTRQMVEVFREGRERDF